MRAAVVFIIATFGFQACGLCEIEGKPYVRDGYAAYKVRRIGIKVRGKWDRPELEIPASVMLPEWVILEIRKKDYELVKQPPRSYPLAGEVRIAYSVKGTGDRRLEVLVEGEISLVCLRGEVVLWRVRTRAKTTANAIGPPLTPDKIEELVQQFYQGVFRGMPKAPRFKMIVGAPYKFTKPLKFDPKDAPVDRLSTGRIIREILSGRWEGVPASIHYVSSGAGTPLVRIWNDSDEQLTVCYKGTVAVDIILAPHSETAFFIRSGSYQVGARAADKKIVPLYAHEEIRTGKNYSVRFTVTEDGY